MKIAINKQDVTEYLLYTLISWYISVAHCSIVLGMTIVAGCKVYWSVTVHTKVYVSYISDVNDIYCMSLYMYSYQILELICAKDSNKGHSVTYDIKKMYSMRDKYTLKIIKTLRVMLKIDM